MFFFYSNKVQKKMYAKSIIVCPNIPKKKIKNKIESKSKINGVNSDNELVFRKIFCTLVLEAMVVEFLNLSNY